MRRIQTLAKYWPDRMEWASSKMYNITSRTFLYRYPNHFGISARKILMETNKKLNTKELFAVRKNKSSQYFRNEFSKNGTNIAFKVFTVSAISL
jgi:hypothetical protein